MITFSPSVCLAFLFSLLFCFKAFGQREVTSSGGDAQGVSGSFSWSLGQTSDLNYSGSNGFISEGIQQPAEFFLTGADLLESPGLLLFPNPGTRNIQLLGLESIPLPAPYQIFNSLGQELLRGELSFTQPYISVFHFPEGTYMLLLPNSPHTPTFSFVKH